MQSTTLNNLSISEMVKRHPSFVEHAKHDEFVSVYDVINNMTHLGKTKNTGGNIALTVN